jgi:glycosyltransferase involved in cell wall biosynthesis
VSASPQTVEPDGPLVTVILPTHRHASTVDLAGESVLRQSISSLELVVIGDGATPEVRAAVAPLLSDERVRFIDRAKTSSRAELVRHEVLAAATSPYVCYLGDDDVMLPDHLASTLARLESVDFTHPLPVFIDGAGTLQVRVTDLAEPRCRAWHQHPSRNAVSLTGVGHRLDAYRRLPHGWREAPPGHWSDHYMWQQWFTGPEFRYATGDRLTVLKFEGADRTDMSDTQRRAEIEAWLLRSREPGFDVWLADRASDAIHRTAIDLRLAVDFQADHFVREREALAAREADNRAELERARTAEREADDRAAEVSARLPAVLASRTWRIRNRLLGRPGS